MDSSPNNDISPPFSALGPRHPEADGLFEQATLTTTLRPARVPGLRLRLSITKIPNFSSGINLTSRPDLLMGSDYHRWSKSSHITWKPNATSSY